MDFSHTISVPQNEKIFQNFLVGERKGENLKESYCQKSLVLIILFRTSLKSTDFYQLRLL